LQQTYAKEKRMIVGFAKEEEPEKSTNLFDEIY